MGFSHERADDRIYAEFGIQSNFSFLRGASSRRSWWSQQSFKDFRRSG
jgi:hypothetical protein